MAGFTIPGAEVVSEWQSPAPVTGIIAKCVQAAEAVITGVYGVLPATPATTDRLATDQILRGEAKPSGASYVGSPAKQLARIGIPNASYGAEWINANDWTKTLNAALAEGKPVLVGFDNARALQDRVTGARPDLGVGGHGATVVGIDAAGTGYLVADPNTAPGAGFMDYSPANLQAAGLSTLIVPAHAPGAVQAGGAGGPVISPTTSGGGFSLESLNPLQIGQAAGAAAGASIWDGISSGIAAYVGDFAIRGALIGLGIVLLGIGLIAFFFAGSGKTVVVEGAKAGAQKAGAAAFA